VHSTAPVDYVSGYHVYLSLNIGYIDECNSRLIIPDITQKFPPKSSNYFITWAKSPPWCSSSSINDFGCIPKLTEAALLGTQWLSNFYSMRHAFTDDATANDLCKCCPSLLKWLAYQRYCYSSKHCGEVFLSDNSINAFGGHASRSLTEFREMKLREVGFQFVVDRDAGLNQWKWLDMYADLSVFYSVYSHCQISKQNNLKLFCLLHTQ